MSAIPEGLWLVFSGDEAWREAGVRLHRFASGARKRPEQARFMDSYPIHFRNLPPCSIQTYTPN
jgi:hypothetical protein